MLEFSKIHAFQHGQRYSFEELVCQLARREKFSLESWFRRVEGAGGDGGVEAYWTKPNGKKTGYQAKYFLRSGDINWGQVDKSVSQAMKTHPDLEKYVIAIPCDLTDKSGKVGRGKTGWEHWGNHVIKWKSEAKALGIKKIEFEAWPQSELVSRLVKPEAVGLREYFFGDIELSIDWFKNNLNDQTLALDERFHPEDHVDVQIQELFSVISRDQVCCERLTCVLNDIESCSLPDKRLSALSKNPDKDTIAAISVAHSNVRKIMDQVSVSPDYDWERENWQQLAEELLKPASLILEWYWNYDRGLKDNEREKYDIRQSIKDINELENTTSGFLNTIKSKFMSAESERLAFVRGSAGTGKSHLLAQCARNAVEQENPAILILGQRLNDSDLWIQIAQYLGLTNQNSEHLLGALNAAGEAAGVRTLILIDAINEGPGSRFWRNNVAGLISKLKKYKHIACVISCRTEYFPLAIPESISKSSQVFDIRGFETPEEQLNAARVFLDRRGIARPSTPWLTPEFVNPLFLRSVCVSLERDGKTEFPKGLNGTRKILKYYLESIGQNLTNLESSAVSLVPNLTKSVQAIASKMVANKRDYLEIDECRQVISKTFLGLQPSKEPDWLSVLLGNGLLRKDPNPNSVEGDTFDDEDVIRYSFQRFQDFLMAEMLLDSISEPRGIFDPGGILEFCIDNKQLSWEWRGLVDALSVALPEQHEIELVDALPGGPENWWNDWSIRESFAESAKWRAHTAFSNRTLELLNQLPNAIDLLLQTAVSVDHPWNAELLHKNLIRKKLPDRDAFWTQWLNNQSEETDSNVGVLIEWCKSGQVPSTNTKNQFLAGLVLCWFFTASNRLIRDKATKSLAALFVANSALFPKLISRFDDIDDIYVLERLLGAAFAACCMAPEVNRLNTYSTVVFDFVFKEGNPPLGLLLRDYALGVLELADKHSALSSNIDISICKPPYNSKRIRLSVSEALLEKVAKQAGGNEIIRSTTSFMGDFFSYEIKPRVGHFLRTPLSKTIPLTPEQKLRVFEDQIIGNDTGRIKAFEDLRNTSNPYSYGIITFPTETEKTPSKSKIEKWQRNIRTAEVRMLKLLNPEEINKFRTDAAPELYNITRNSRKDNKFDIVSSSRWIAKRAYDYGWTSTRFQNDQVRMGRFSRDRPIVERIGKKYEWLALNEFTCRLADNYWLESEFGNLPKVYAGPLDLGFERDIDPTIIEECENSAYFTKGDNTWVIQPQIILDEVSEKELLKWPFLEDPSAGLGSMQTRTDLSKNRWFVLYEHQSQTIKYDGDRTGEHGLRQQEFRFLASVIVKKVDAKSIAEKFKNDNEIDIHHWAMSDVIDAAYLFEAPWRNTWQQEKWRFDGWKLPTGIGFAQLISGYHWESHLDAALPEGYKTHLPTPWLAIKLGLTPALDSTGVWYDVNGEIVFQELRGGEGGVVCLFREDQLLKALGDNNCVLTVLISEHNVWPGGSNTNAARRRAEGVCWHDGKKMNVLNWKRDTRNG